MTEGVNRRQLMARGTTAGLFMVSGQWLWMNPAEAQAQGFTPQILAADQASALATLADALVPGAKAAGIAPYIDAQLAKGDNSLLIAKYLGVDIPNQTEFYRAIASNLLLSLRDGNDAEDMAGKMASDTIDGWQGPPASYALFVLRCDALDGTYGHSDGFEQLRIPYMAHITPVTPW